MTIPQQRRPETSDVTPREVATSLRFTAYGLLALVVLGVWAVTANVEATLIAGALVSVGIGLVLIATGLDREGDR